MLIIAEVGSVHDGSYGNAKKLIEAAALAGADAVKFQTHIADAESLVSAPVPTYFSDESRMSYFRRTSFTIDQWRNLKAHAVTNGITFMSSPFSLEAVDLLEEIGITGYKIPSGEVSNIPLLERVASTGKPVFLSSGMSNWDELDVAVATLRDSCDTTVMQCSSVYPCPPEQVGLNVIKELFERYRLPVGYSDHTLGVAAPIGAAALGARVIEKHFTFSRLMYGSDARHSMEPEEFRNMCIALREVWSILDSPVSKSDASPYTNMKRIFEKSIVTSRALKSGVSLRIEDISFKKPGDGISAAKYKQVLGRCVARDLPAGHKIEEGDLQ